MGWFTKKRPDEHEDLGPMDSSTVYQQVWERKRLPDEGAQSYAYESLDLAQFTYIGPAVAVRNPDPVPPLVQQVYSYQAGTVIGLPGLSAGQFYSTPLYDQNGNPVDGGLDYSYARLNDVVDQPNPVFWNQAVISDQPGQYGSAVANQPFPVKVR